VRIVLYTVIYYLAINYSYSSSLNDKYVDTSLRIMAEALTDSTAYNRLAFLCDKFGPRLSGSPNLENAINWILKEMKKDSLDNVRGERVKVPVWKRGKESLKLLKPHNRELRMLGLGGSVSTPRGGIVGDLLVVDNFEDLKNNSNKVNGKIILFNCDFTTYGETVLYRYNGAIEAAKLGAVASLIRSIGDWSMNTPHTGNTSYHKDVKKIPHAAITMEDAGSFKRLSDRGERITLKLDMDAKTGGDSWSRNIIAEIIGSEYPDEIIVVGGHIDSWDVGQGAHDDGGACIASWEVLRLIKALKLKPKRTIRCVLWTNEENGGMGSKAYRDMHLDELKNHIVAIESDGGVFAPEGFGFSGSDEAFEIVKEIHKLLKPLKAQTITRGGRAADVAPLNDQGVPVMSLKVDNSKYFWYHHTDADTFDKVNLDEFNSCVAAMAIMAYTIADMEKPIPR
jgi:carboxypeptidase Q